VRVLHFAPTAMTLRLFVLPLIDGLESRGYSSEFMVSPNETLQPLHGRVSGFNLYRGWGFWLSWVSNFEPLKQLVLSKPDIIHIHTPASALGMLPFLAVLRQKGIRLVYTARGGLDEGVALPLRILWKVVNPLRWAVWDALAVVNESLLHDARGRRRRVPVVLLSCGAAVPNLEKVASVNPGSLMTAPSTTNTVRLAWVGRFSRDKRPQDFLTLVGKLRDEYGLDVEGLVIGDSNAVDRATLNHLHDSIHTTGWVEAPQTYLRFCDFLISTSVREGYGLVPIEAGLVGTPAIGYRTRGTSKSIPEAGGMLVDCGDLDAIARQVATWAKLPHGEQQSLRREVMGKSRETLSRSQLADEIADLYRQALK